MAMKILNLKKVRKYTDKEYWVFNLSLCGFIINGFVYSREKGAVLAPTAIRNGKRTRMVKAFGMQIKRLKALLEEELARVEDANARTALSLSPVSDESQLPCAESPCPDGSISTHQP